MLLPLLVDLAKSIKRWKLAILSVEFMFLPFVKCVTSSLDFQKWINYDQNLIPDVNLGY
jgi:hypothetical protein